MTEHTVTIEKTVEQDETVVTCDYCGLGGDAGEMLTFEYAGSDGYEGVGELFDTSAERGDEFPDLHYHVSCLPNVLTDEDAAEAMTLSDQYRRRTGNGLVLAFPQASVLFMTMGNLAALGWWYMKGTLLGMMAAVVSIALWAFVLWGARRTAKATVREFQT
jgi:hypothetical protein